MPFARMQFITILHSVVPMPLLFIAVAVMTRSTLDAQTVNWAELGPPSARCCMGMAYDGATHSTVLFGGTGPVPDQTIYGDTWIWHGGWFRVSPATSPSPRNSAVMAYDGAAGNVVLFGGYSSTGTYLDDTWTWDGNTWTQQLPPVSPPARNGYGNMVYDAATQTVVLFGGNNSAGVLGDTWTWDGIAKTWTRRSPPASPVAESASMAYDAATRTVVLFGSSADTWTWNGIAWTQQFPASAPSARIQQAMTYDSDLGVVVLFGGAVGGIWEDSTNDTWMWNGTKWTEIRPATVPPNRYAFGMDYDVVNKAVFMFGGYSSTVVRGDTWLLALAP